ncbi:unnamed protein product [Plutella xylostella]|uniref:NOC3-like protein n=1 Tax=Plutella xylostella TaxID=51655 RepID=A0A8S4FRF9_PLUXY|nr:unnamed protein product [Plutella xylostella]
MAKKGKAKISKVKRNNQTTNKMKKQGTLRLQRHRTKVQKQRAPAVPQVEYSSDSDSAEGEEWADMLDEDEQKYIMSRLAKDSSLLSSVPDKEDDAKETKKRKRSRDKPKKPQPTEQDSGADSDSSVSDTSDIEEAYEAKVAAQPPKKLRPLLPIKTKEGVVERAEECAESESEEEELPPPSQPEEQHSESDSGLEGTGEEGEDPPRADEEGGVIGAVQLMAARRDTLNKEKLRIGSLCSSLLEAPEKKLKNLYPILYLMEESLKDGTRNLVSVRKLAALSAREVFKDILPDYQIRHQDYSTIKLKKDTLALYKYEKELLEFYKRFLQRLEKATAVLRQRRGDHRKIDESATSLAHVALSCMCDMLTAKPNFNYALNIAQSVVPLLGCRDPVARKTVNDGLVELLKEDKKGDITLVIVRLINQLVKKRGERLPPSALDCLLALRIRDVDLDEQATLKAKQATDNKKKKRIINLSKKEKKSCRVLLRRFLSRSFLLVVLSPSALACLLALRIRDVDLDEQATLKAKQATDNRKKKRIINLSKKEKKATLKAKQATDNRKKKRIINLSKKEKKRVLLSRILTRRVLSHSVASCRFLSRSFLLVVLSPSALDCLLALRIRDVDLDEQATLKAKQATDNKKKKRIINLSKKEKKATLKAKQATDNRKKKRIINLSKKEKKRAKKLKEVEQELLETEAQENDLARKKQMTEVTQIVFHIYFRILKNSPNSKLLSAVLTGLARFTHVINLDFYSELVSILTRLMSSDLLTLRMRVQCVRCALALLGGAARAVSVDPAGLCAALYQQMMEAAGTSDPDTSRALLESLSLVTARARSVSAPALAALSKRAAAAALHSPPHQTLAGLVQLHALMLNPEGLALVTNILLESLSLVTARARSVSAPALAALSKRAAATALHAPPHQTLAGLLQLHVLMLLHLHALMQNKAVSSLLDTSESTGSGRYDPYIPSPEHCNAHAAILYELTALSRHFHPTVREVAAGVLKGEAKSGLDKLTPIQVYNQYDGSQMTFKPAVPPPKKVAPKRLAYTHTWTQPAFKEHCLAVEEAVPNTIEFKEAPAKKRKMR